MNLEEQLFSVVIPLYNKQDTIAGTLNSVFQQTFPGFEVLVVDDGSTDDSLSIVKLFCDSRLRVFTKRNGGVSEARNYAIKRARNPFIAFLDADDKWDSNYLEEMKCLIEKYPCCGIYASAFKKVMKDKTVMVGAEVPEGIVDDFFKTRLFHQVPWTSATIVQKEVFAKVGGFPVGMIGGEDDYTWSKIAIEYKVAFMPQLLATYYFTSGSYAWRKGKPDSCQESWFDFYKADNFYRNEFVAQKAIHAGIRYALGLSQKKSNEIEKFTRFTVLSRKKWRYLYLLNRVPYKVILAFGRMWNACKFLLTWLLKGLHLQMAKPPEPSPHRMPDKYLSQSDRA